MKFQDKLAVKLGEAGKQTAAKLGEAGLQTAVKLGEAGKQTAEKLQATMEEKGVQALNKIQEKVDEKNKQIVDELDKKNQEMEQELEQMDSAESEEQTRQREEELRIKKQQEQEEAEQKKQKLQQELERKKQRLAEELATKKRKVQEEVERKKKLEQEALRQKERENAEKRKKSMIGLSILFVLSLVGLCFISFGPEGDHIGEVEIPASYDSLAGENYKNVMTMFEEAGFENIETEEIDDLVVGILTEENEVEDVSVNGDTEFTSGEWVDQNAKVLIRYHVYPDEEVAEEETAPSGEAGTEARLTVDNCPELAAMLSNKSDNDPSYAAFAKEHEHEVIEFDGRVNDLVPHESYKTRYDVAVSAGDYNPESMSGPYFKFEDVNAFDMGLNSVAVISTGTNIHIVAKVLEFDENSLLFFLNPVEVTVR